MLAGTAAGTWMNGKGACPVMGGGGGGGIPGWPYGKKGKYGGGGGAVGMEGVAASGLLSGTKRAMQHAAKV